MDDKNFVWSSELNKKMFQLRFENDWLFKTNKQPWREFYKILLRSGFPKTMTIDHVRKKWSYTYDMYKLAKKTNNRSWKYYKMFDKHFGKSKVLDKYESWNNEWRLKLIICISEAKEMKIDFQTMWRTVERAMRCQNLPKDCCIQDIKGLWHHIRMTFNRKHRLGIKKGKNNSDWSLYVPMYTYYQKFEPDYLLNLETQPARMFVTKTKKGSRYIKNKSNVENNENESDFQWSKDITETFIQIRLQNDWLFRQRRWAWNELLKIMVEEYGFPKTLTSRELGRKWAATFSEYQKAKATNNKSWVYHTLFELYLGESSLSLNPLVDWQEEWVFHLITTRTDLEHLFTIFKDKNKGWREVEKRLRCIGLPIDHSLLELPEIWTHLLKMFKWKRKFANKGLLTEQWPYFEAMTRYKATQEKQESKRQKDNDIEEHYTDVANDDDHEDNIKLFDLKQKLQLSVKPKNETSDVDQCRSCLNLQACINIFDEGGDDELNVAYKLKTIGGVEVDKSDNLPSHICLDCLEELENAYKFRRKCQDVDKQLRNATHEIKVEVLENQNNLKTHEIQEEYDGNIADDEDLHLDPDPSDCVEGKVEAKLNLKKEKILMKKKKLRKLKYDYWKICEVCGKPTKNLISHLDTHSSGKTYSCDVCDKRFKFKSGLLIHKAVHNPTPRKTCEVCGKTFHILAQYRRHFVYHANERKFECEICGKRFNTSDILKVHNRTHNDERPFSCKDCGKTFRTAGCVSRHRRIVHRHIKKV